MQNNNLFQTKKTKKNKHFYPQTSNKVNIVSLNTQIKTLFSNFQLLSLFLLITFRLKIFNAKICFKRIIIISKLLLNITLIITFLIFLFIILNIQIIQLPIKIINLIPFIIPNAVKMFI